MPNEPTTGTRSRRHGAPPAGYNRIPARSVSRMKATTVRPTNAPISNVSTRNTCSSRSCSNAFHCRDGACHQADFAVKGTGVLILLTAYLFLRIDLFCEETFQGAHSQGLP